MARRSAEHRERRQREQLRQRVHADHVETTSTTGRRTTSRTDRRRSSVRSARAAPLAVQRQVRAAANGTWKLRITDSFAGDTGLLQCWSLNINTGPPSAWSTTSTATALPTSPSSGPQRSVVRQCRGQRGARPGGRRPRVGDYDGNGLADVAVYRPSTGQWFIAAARRHRPWGQPGDIRCRRTTTATRRPTPRCIARWRRRRVVLEPARPGPVTWGNRGDVPMPGDYDGDTPRRSRRLPAVDGQWFIAYAPAASPPAVSSRGACPATSRSAPTSTTTSGWISWSSARRRARGSCSPTNSRRAPSHRAAGDIPRGLDIDGDGFAELCIFRHRRASGSCATASPPHDHACCSGNRRHSGRRAAAVAERGRVRLRRRRSVRHHRLPSVHRHVVQPLLGLGRAFTTSFTTPFGVAATSR
jgi:hypothetical protein